MTKLKLFGCALAAIAMLALAGCKNNKKGDQASYNDNSDTMNDPYKEYSFNDEPETPVSEQTPTTTTPSTTEQEPVMTEDKNGNLSEVTDPKDLGNIYIVAGSFTLYNNAQKLNNKLKAKGYDSKILEPYGQYHRVTVKQFKTVAEARAALPTLRKNIDQALWLLTR
ncbi:MAG: SPOR domain-containing protein [Bacteroidales bacterium]|jgi:cell division protein FtsN|nr:SPOR domain-containing protein [Bacteroidales bacterium]